MPEFHARCIPATIERTLDPFTRAYLECAEFTDTPDDPAESWDDAEWSSDAIAQAKKECADFYTAHKEDCDTYGLPQVAHDFWCTRNGHGVGFWENDYATPEICERLNAAAKHARERSVYLGDDGYLYFEGR